jgi:radical SAM superfamily enzyme YgiQ (UPF0313 family)
MNVLLLSMPDSFEHMSSITTRMPNGALGSLAGNLDRHHRVAVADLILVQDRVRRNLERLVAELAPDVVGLSVMTFQRRTAQRIVALLRALRPGVRIVVGGYDPSLAPEAYTAEGPAAVDFIVRGEGEPTFRELLRALESGSEPSRVSGLWYRAGDGFRSNPPRPVTRLAQGEIRLPRRAARVLSGYTLLGKPVDVVETSRGCTFDCSFCSIIEMRGRNFHTFPLERVLADIRDARDHGARAIFLVDDNITLDAARFETLCAAILDAGLSGIEYLVQAMTSAIANAPERLVALMRRAGFRYVFLGIENVLEEDLGFLRAAAKNARREHGRRVGNASVAAIEALHRHGILVVGGLIVGSPTDTRDAIEANLAFARRYVDWPYIQHPTPYPATPMARQLREQGLIISDAPEEYDGTTAVVRSQHLGADEIEFLRWRAERWMKVRHFPAALAHSPWFVLRNGRRMLAHTFRGSSWRSALGLESQRRVFERYRAIRRAERDYLAT